MLQELHYNCITKLWRRY